MTVSNTPGHPPAPFLKAAFAHTRMAMIATDPYQADNPIVFANDAFLHLTGYGLDEVVGKNCRFLQGPDTDQEVVEKIRASIAEQTFGYFELLNYKKDGTPFWNALHISPVYDDDGKLTHFFGSQWDITVQREAVDALTGDVRLTDHRLQEAIDRTRELEFALNQANDSVLMTEYAPLEKPGPRITWVSKGFERMTGYAANEVVGKTPRILQGPLTDRKALAALKESLVAGQGHEHTRTVNYKKDGTPFYVEWSVSPTFNESGEPNAWLAVQRDVTATVAAEEERERLIRELDHRVRNLFSTVQVITRGAGDGDGTAEGLRSRLLYQLQALASAHDLVFRDASQQAPMAAVVDAVLEPFDPDRTLIVREGSESRFAGKQAVNAAIILYELARLSSERGALHAKKPCKLSWALDGDELQMTWAEPAELPDPRQFGFGLVRTFVHSSKWDQAGIEEIAGGFVVRLGLRAS
ncbi:MAG: PAS domain-containing protein [Pseudomonadota bacterium]